MLTNVSQMIMAPYGAPDATSEVNRIPGFYRAEALMAGAYVHREAPEAEPTLCDRASKISATAAEAIRDFAEAVIPSPIVRSTT